MPIRDPSRVVVLCLAIALTLAGSPIALNAFQAQAGSGGVIPIAVENHVEGAPLTFGIPFPRGALAYSHNVRVLTPQGTEIPSQVTEVNSWAPADDGVKWLWVHFVAGPSDRYQIQYGPNVRRSARLPEAIRIVSPQGQFTEVSTGPLRFVVGHGAQSGFLDIVQLDTYGTGFDDASTIATGQRARGSFVDLLDDAGLDPSRAVVTRVTIEKGSGPMHAIIRVDGEYQHSREDNNASPFITRIHAYAGRTHLRVLHTFIYTGNPDKKQRAFGENALVATQAEHIVPETPGDSAWMQPDDRVASVGLGLDLKLTGQRRYLTSLRNGRWWEDGQARRVGGALNATRELSLVQSGPEPTRVPPFRESSRDERIDGFRADIVVDGTRTDGSERSDGWIDLSDGTRGVAIGMRSFIEEYPKEIGFAPDENRATAFIWSPRAEPMSYARSSTTQSGGQIANYAQGHGKTSEIVLYFHGADASADDIERTVNYVLNPPVAHAEPTWYAASGVYGDFAPRSNQFREHETWLDNRFDWMLFSQKWAPWYGMIDYGDFKEHFNGTTWSSFGHNEPSVDFILWFQFMRTGDPRFFLAAEASSRHSMDVDNTHWPADPVYYADNNNAVDWFRHQQKPRGSPLVGAGRRHAEQHWSQVMGAHVWAQGWTASYYLAAYHRGLDIATQTADFHMRRAWGEFELDARRLPLAVWNLLEVWDATKEDRYHDEIKDRIDWMYSRQLRDQGNLVMDRYGFSYIYSTHALARYYDLTGDKRVRSMLVTNAQRVRDVPPVNRVSAGAGWNGDGDWAMVSSVHGLVVGYQLTGDVSMLDAARERIALMKATPLSRPVDSRWTLGALHDELQQTQTYIAPFDGTYIRNALQRNVAGRIGGGSSPGPWGVTDGFHDFGFIYVLPYALHVLREADVAVARDDDS